MYSVVPLRWTATGCWTISKTASPKDGKDVQFSRYRCCRLEQNAKAPLPILSIAPSHVTVVRDSQVSNTPSANDVTPEGMVISVRAQPENADPSIDVKQEGFSNSTLARLLQLLNAHQPIDWTLDGMVISVRALQPRNAIRPIELKEEFSSNSTLARFVSS